MEYSECLDAAAAERDSLKRLAFVAGFAMSNYASTIGRIAKPFNPMLSETFELVNLDKTYRYSGYTLCSDKRIPLNPFTTEQSANRCHTIRLYQHVSPSLRGGCTSKSALLD